jgi:hypothetical protein
LRVILTLAFSYGVSARALQIDAHNCAAELAPANLEKFLADHGVRRDLKSAGGPVAGTYISGDAKDSKMIDVRGTDFAALTQALIRKLGYDQDSQKIPRLAETIEAALKIAHAKPAAFSISSWVVPDGARTVRLSLDLSARAEDRSQFVRLADLEIRNGTPVRRVDIDLSPERLTLLTGTTQALHVGERWLIGEAASHSLGLEIDGSDPHAVIIDSFGSPAERFIGPEAHPELRELLALAENLARALFPTSGKIQFREYDDIKAVSEGRGWQTVN